MSNEIHYLAVYDETYSEEDESGRDYEGGEYSTRPDTTTYHDPQYLFSCRSGDAVSFVPVANQTYYAVCVIYHNGDSFGMDYNHTLMTVEIYEDEEMANNACSKINQDYFYFSSKPEPLVIIANNGEPMQVYRSWSGMFSGMGECNVYALSYNADVGS